ncbi:hypothetical protein GQ53DRAFT_818521 [Thozetella sp. PMI_491]|nr:hypothetical protein GQ53DRAFT_818521 [Thozetella sp. PMI_491]
MTFDLQAEWGIGVNPKVGVIAELTEGPHPCATLQIPLVGPVDIWKEASRLALLFYWYDNPTTQWQMAYYIVEKIHPPNEDLQESVKLRDWLKVIYIIAFLERWKWSSKTKEQLKLGQTDTGTFSVARVFSMDFDFFGKSINFTLDTKRRHVEVHERNMADAVWRTARFRVGVDYQEGTNPDFVSTRLKRERNCDVCYLNKRRDPGRTKCDMRAITYQDGPNQRSAITCDLCFSLGRCCTFTHDFEKIERAHTAVFRPLFFMSRRFSSYPLAQPPTFLHHWVAMDSVEDEVIEEEVEVDDEE